MGEPARQLEEPTEAPPRIAPQPGPQMQFAQCEADIAFFGGQAGGGKSFALLYEAGKWTHLPKYLAGLFRRETTQLVGPGGLWDESRQIYEALGGKSREGQWLDWRFESGARIKFGHLQHEDDRFKHQGMQYAFLGFDEVTHFTETQFWYLFGRLRSTCGVKPYLRATCNPDPDSFVFKLIEWWIDDEGLPIPERAGVLRWFVRLDDKMHWFDSEEEAREAHPDERPKSLTFIPSKITDNPALLEADPDAISKLQAQSRVDRKRLLEGNWKARATAGMVFKRADFRRVFTRSEMSGQVLRAVRFWDKAASEPTPKHPDPDWTRGVRMLLLDGGRIFIDDVVSLRARGTDVLALQRRTAERDGVHVTQGIWQDTGGAGKTDVDTTITALAGYPVEVVESFSADTRGLSGSHRSTKAKRAFADAWAPWVERGSFYVLEASWADELLNECDAFPDARHDDIVDAISGGFQLLAPDAGTSLIEAMQGITL